MVCVADSEFCESGDLLPEPEADWAERRPERRVSRGDRGGPMFEGFAIECLAEGR